MTLNSAAVRQPGLVTEIARRFGSQCAVVAIEAKRAGPGRWTAMIENGREPTGLDVVEWAARVSDLGAGEILLTSIDQDGTRRGCDLELTRAVAEKVSIPVIASGGPGKVEHVVDAFQVGQADAVALGTLLHFNLSDVASVRRAVANAGVAVRAA